MSSLGLVPLDLRCAHKQNPLGVEPDRARFAWRCAAAGPGTGAPTGRWQSAYQVMVGLDGGDLEPGALSWDSGRVTAQASTDVAYGGAPLRPAQKYFWKARVWDETGELGPWSSPASFETALGPAGWSASWIGLGPGQGPTDPPGPGAVDAVALAMQPAPYLRRAFTLDQDVVSARLYATALGIYQLSVNGRPVSDGALAPGWTDYARRLLYQTYDVTELLQRGDNVIGAIVADGWACGFYGFDAKHAGAHYARDPELLAQLVITTGDGGEKRIVTDHRWRSSTGAILHADLLMGEHRDQRREPPSWDRPGYDDSPWRPASRRERGNVALVADPGPPIRVTEELPARTVRPAPGGGLIVDFGQNLAGWVRLKCRRAGRHRHPRPPWRGAGRRRRPVRRQSSYGAPDGPVHDGGRG